jgi:hypothetical protein
MPTFRLWISTLAVCAGMGAAGAAMAQPANLDPQRDCQTIRSCNFARGGVYRGCISSYSCRTCRFVRASCFVDGRRSTCQELRCTWG